MRSGTEKLIERWKKSITDRRCRIRNQGRDCEIFVQEIVYADFYTCSLRDQSGRIHVACSWNDIEPL